jgi:flavin reductase (DIM6/NTAB) family NADH-FMN oxidoreductase RutF
MIKVDLPARLRMDFPVPIVVISCSAGRDKPNLITLGAVSGAGYNPPMWGILVSHTAHSYQIISHSDGFVINVPSRIQAEIVDYCGTVSGREVDKFKACGLTPFPSTKISSPAILEFPLNIECATRKSVNLGSNSFFFGEIMAVHCDKSILNSKGAIDKQKLQPMCAFVNSYWSLGDSILEFGRSSLIPRRPKQTS